MRDNLPGAIWRLGIFVLVCLLGLGALLAIFAQLRFQEEKTYQALFDNVSGLANGNFVRIAGVEVGKVKSLTVRPDNTVAVGFSADDSVVLTEGTRAVVRYDNLIGGRYLALEEGTGGLQRLEPGGTIPLDRTQPALDLDALIGGFRPLFRALEPEQINALSGQLIDALQGQGATVGSFLAQTAALTNTLADRDQLIRDVIDNLSTVMGSLGEQSGQFSKAVDSLSQIVEGLAERRSEVTNAVASTSSAADSLTDLLVRSHDSFAKTVRESDRAAGIVISDHAYFDDFLNTLPGTFQALGRQGIHGDFFSFYLCDIVLKLNGKGGQPVYVKVAGQDTGRCTPR